MPSNESGGVLNMWFSWNYADVHFVSIDTSTDFPNAPEGKTGKFDLTISVYLFFSTRISRIRRLKGDFGGY